MSIIVSCNGCSSDDLTKHLHTAQLPVPALVCTSYSTAISATAARVEQEILASDVKYGVNSTNIDVVMLGIDDIVVNELSARGVAYHIVQVCLSSCGMTDVSMTLFQPHHSIEQMDGIDIISKLFPHAYSSNSIDVGSNSNNSNNNARVSVANMVSYTELMQKVTSSHSFCRAIQTSSLLLQQHFKSFVINLWWLQGAHIHQCLFRDVYKDEWRSSFFLFLLNVCNVADLQVKLNLILPTYSITEEKSPSRRETQNLSRQVERTQREARDETYRRLLNAKLQEKRAEVEKLVMSIQKQQAKNEWMEETLHYIRETARELIIRKDHLGRELYTIMNARGRKVKEQQEELLSFNTAEGQRLAALRRKYENEVQLEMEHLEDLQSRSGRTREDEERRALMQTVMLRKQLDTAHEMREKLRDDVSQWRMKVKTRRGSREGKGGESTFPSLLPSLEQGVALQEREVGAESAKQKQGIQQQQQQQQKRQDEVELHRINKDILNISKKLTALRQERDELETLKEWWRAKAEETMKEEEEGFNQNTNFEWEEIDKRRDMLQNALGKEEYIARQSLYAMELAARRENCELEWCVQSHHKRCGCTGSDPYQQKQHREQEEELVLSIKEKRCRDEMFREIERLTRLKAAVRHEMHEVRLQSITRENNLRQQLEKLRIESVRLEQQRNTYVALDECGETALEKEELVLWRISQLLETCLRVDTPFIRAENINPTITLTDWRNIAEKLMLQLQRVKHDILVVKDELETLRLKCNDLERQTAAEEDSLEAIMLEKKALKWYVHAYEQDA